MMIYLLTNYLIKLKLMKKIKLLKKEIGELNTVYDIQVEDAHHYVSTGGVVMHNSIGSFIPGQTMSGGGGAIYNSSVILQLSKAGLKEGDADAVSAGIQKTGIIVTSKVTKNRFARPIPVKFHISFYKGMNPYVGLEAYINWENCGIQRGKIIDEKTFEKYHKGKASGDTIEKTRWTYTDEKGKEQIRYFEAKETARSLVVRHLNAEVKVNELFTPKVITDEILHMLDDTIIKKQFMLPNISDLHGVEDMELENDVFDTEIIDEDGE